jgi:hypothetical protein
MAHRRALIFDRILDVDTDAQIVRVRPQRAAAVALAIVIAAFPAVLLVITHQRPYGLTLYGTIFTWGYLLAAVVVLAIAFSPGNRFVELDFRNRRARIGRRFGLGRPIDVALDSVAVHYDESIKEVANQTIVSGKAVASFDGKTFTVLAISGEHIGLAEALAAAVVSGGQSLPELGELTGRVGSSEARRVISTVALILGCGVFYLWWYLYR